MAKAARKPKGKPITANPLFPAVVALWFGALFGLGSLAIRPALLDSFVIANRIDLIIAAATPPLGVTARIVIALVMAALGALLGALLARRIAAPRKEKAAPRRRGATSTEAKGSYFGRAEARNSDGEWQGRRRALAIEPEEQEFVPHDMAPLPGGQPQILDIGGIDLEPAPVAQHEALDLATYAEPAPFVPPAAEVAPVVPAVEPIQQFAPQPATSEPIPTWQPPVEAPAAPAAPVPVVAAFAEPERQIFGQPVAEGHVPSDFVRDLGFKTSVFETEEAAPLFPVRDEPIVTPEPVAIAAPQVETAPAITAPVETATTPEPQPELVPEPEPAVEPAAPIAGLGMTDLASRLADSMRRRRAARAGQAEADVVPAEAAEAIATPEPAAVADEAPDFAAPAFEAPAAPVSPLDMIPPPPPFFDAAAQPAAVVEPAPAPAPAPAPLAMPAALRPLELTLEDEDDTTALDSLLPPRLTPAPAAPPVVEAVPVAAAPLAEPAIDEQPDEARFASLLDVGQPLSARSTHARIEEPPVADETAIEPVVIFPGQAPRSNPAPFAAPVSPAADAGQPVPFRRFDAPAAATPGQPVDAGPAATPLLAGEEAERALRSALANLQRMSGAA